MNRLHPWRSVSQATRKAALLCFSAVLVMALALAAAAPARAAGCAYVTGGRMFFSDAQFSFDFGQQATRQWASRPSSVFRCACRTAPQGRDLRLVTHLPPPAPGQATSSSGHVAVL